LIKKIKVPKKKSDKIDTVFVHIGKCGGSSVIEELKRKNIKFFEKHVESFKFRKDKKYIIILRNPISRFVSAFNWRYKLVVEDGTQKSDYHGERELLEKYKNANDLAEGIYNDKNELIIDFQREEFYIHHLKEDINFYIGDLLKNCKKKNIRAVLATESLNDDLKRHFDITLKSHLKKNAKRTHLSIKAVNNLVKYFEKDYYCIERLNEMGLLTENQYKNLSNKTFN